MLNHLRSLDRFWLHVPIGLVLIWMLWIHWMAMLVSAAMFLAYEVNEDRYIRDEAWKDIAGSMFGLMLGGVVWTVIKLWVD